MSSPSAAIVSNKSKGRSRIANGSTLFGKKVDGRSPWARLMRDTFRSLVVHCGGDGVVSETRRLAARRVSVLESELVFLEERFAEIRAAGSEPNPQQLDLYGRLADRQRRLSEPLGWDRQPRDLEPDLESYVRQVYGVPEQPAGTPIESGRTETLPDEVEHTQSPADSEDTAAEDGAAA